MHASTESDRTNEVSRPIYLGNAAYIMPVQGGSIHASCVPGIATKNNRIVFLASTLTSTLIAVRKLCQKCLSFRHIASPSK